MDYLHYDRVGRVMKHVLEFRKEGDCYKILLLDDEDYSTSEVTVTLEKYLSSAKIISQ